MSAALQSSDLFPKVPRVSLSEVPEVSAYFKNTLRAMFGEDEDKVRSYVQEITQMSWTPEKMRERLAGIEDGEQLKSAMRRLRRDVMMSLVARDISGLANLEEVVTSMSDLAEITIDRTVSVYAKELAKRFGVPRSETGVPQDLIVIGMGKLAVVCYLFIEGCCDIKRPTDISLFNHICIVKHVPTFPLRSILYS